MGSRHSVGRPISKSALLRVTSTALALLAPGTVFAAGGSIFPSPAFGPVSASTLSVADFDEDGRDDLATVGYQSDGTYAWGIVVLHAKGAIGFEQRFFEPSATQPTYAAATGDLDGDGKIDILVRRSSPERFLRSSGVGDASFLPAVDVGPSAGGVRLLLGDMTMDGRLDTIEVYGSSVRIGIGQANGSIQLGPEWNGIGVGDAVPALADFDLDGDLDLATGSKSFQSVATLLGDGAGGFSGAWRSFVPNLDTGLAAGDLDSDGRLDLAVGCGQNGVKLLFSQSAGSFSTNLGSAYSTASTVAIIDIDGDGDLDLGCAGGQVLRNDGAANFVSNGVNVPTGQIVAGHFTDDPSGEFAVASSSIAIVGLDSTGAATSNASLFQSTSAHLVVTADLDLDQDDDLVLAGSGSPMISTWMRTGPSQYTQGGSISLSANAINDLAAIDIDLDGDRDLLVSGNVNQHFSQTTQIYLVLGDGLGGFGAPLALQSNLPYPGYRLCTGDIDGDQDPDLLVYGGPSAVWVFRNQGGTLAAGVQYNVGLTSTQFAATGDINHDGTDDVVLSSSNYGGSMNSIAILAGTASGTLIGPSYVSMPGTFTLALVDLDGDGHRDLFTGSAVARGNGIGGFFAPKIIASPGIAYSQSVIAETLVGDVDGDGIEDAVVPMLDQKQIYIPRESNGQWAYVAYPVDANAYGLSFARIDDDALPDLVVATGTGSLVLMRNEAQFAAAISYGVAKVGSTGLPSLASDSPVVGVPTELRIEHGIASISPFLLVGFAPTALPFDQGTLLVAPATVLTLPPFGPTGSLQLPFTLPAGISLCGKSIYLQAMWIDPLGSGPAKTAQTRGLEWRIGF